MDGKQKDTEMLCFTYISGELLRVRKKSSSTEAGSKWFVTGMFCQLETAHESSLVVNSPVWASLVAGTLLWKCLLVILIHWG